MADIETCSRGCSASTLAMRSRGHHGRGLGADGCAIVERLVAPELLARLNAELEARIAEKAPGSADVGEMMGWFWGQQTKRFSPRLAAFAPAFAELLTDEFMHRWAARPEGRLLAEHRRGR